MEVCTLHQQRLATPHLSFLLVVLPLVGCQLQNLLAAFLGALFANLAPGFYSLILIPNPELLSPQLLNVFVDFSEITPCNHFCYLGTSTDI